MPNDERRAREMMRGGGGDRNSEELGVNRVTSDQGPVTGAPDNCKAIGSRQ